MNILEQELLKTLRQRNQVGLERALLIISGCQEEWEIEEYKKSLDHIQKDFRKYSAELQWYRKVLLTKAQLLHDYLWETKPDRYHSKSNSLLTDVIDAQLDKEKYNLVGNGAGLLALYTVMALREDIDFSLDIRQDGEKNVRVRDLRFLSTDIDPRDPEKVKRFLDRYEPALSPESIIFLTFFYRATDKFEKKDFKGAVKDYEITVELNPDFIPAYHNLGVARSMLGE